jgi:predicted RNase H-like HicB family nuclease
MASMLKIEIDREEDGRWIAEVPSIPGALAYGATESEAHKRVAALALRVLADRVEHDEPIPPEARELLAFA